MSHNSCIGTNDSWEKGGRRSVKYDGDEFFCCCCVRACCCLVLRFRHSYFSGRGLASQVNPTRTKTERLLLSSCFVNKLCMYVVTTTVLGVVLPGGDIRGIYL